MDHCPHCGRGTLNVVVDLHLTLHIEADAHDVQADLVHIQPAPIAIMTSLRPIILPPLATCRWKRILSPEKPPTLTTGAYRATSMRWPTKRAMAIAQRGELSWPTNCGPPGIGASQC